MPNERTAGALGLAASMVPAIAGVAASAMLLVDYTRPAPVFCVEGGGCDALKHTVFAMPLGVPMPLFGLLGFLALGVASLFAGPRARLVQIGLSLVAGFVGLALLVVQLRLGKLCPFCCVADTSGIVAAAVAMLRSRYASGAPSPRGLAYGGAAVLFAAIAAPLIGGFRASTVPVVIRAEVAQTPPGQVTVVDFVDFECPFCRMTDEVLEPVLEKHRGRVRLVRKQVPLKMHVHALDAARAACCGEKLGQGDTMARGLFSTPEDELTREGCEKLAHKLGVSLDAYRACLADPSIDDRIAADKAEFQAAGGFALPTIWIGETQLVGAQSQEAIEQALTEAEKKAGS
jgi:protein-disulfide isomerase